MNRKELARWKRGGYQDTLQRARRAQRGLSPGASWKMGSLEACRPPPTLCRRIQGANLRSTSVENSGFLASGQFCVTHDRVRAIIGVFKTMVSVLEMGRVSVCLSLEQES